MKSILFFIVILSFTNVYSQGNIEMVNVTDFAIGKYEVTHTQWQAVMGGNLSAHMGCSECPVENVSWDNIQEFLQKLNQETGKKYRLPTQSEWEFAARGGNLSHNYKYSGSSDIDSVAWSKNNSDNKTHPVGQKKPNELGIYDMSGNVSEWCSDFFNGNYPIRGGSWYNDITNCRINYRIHFAPNAKQKFIGFRLAYSLDSK